MRSRSIAGTGTVEIHCAFRQQADADSFAASIQAVAVDIHPGWLSQRTFTIDVAAAQRIERTRDDLLRAKGTATTLGRQDTAIEAARLLL
jgi:hypothetical protein